MYQFMGGAAVPQSPIFYLFLYLVCSLIFLFAGVYYWLGVNPGRVAGGPVAMISLLGKLLFTAVFFSYAFAGLIPWPLAGMISGDFVYALLFLEYVLFSSSRH